MNLSKLALFVAMSVGMAGIAVAVPPQDTSKQDMQDAGQDAKAAGRKTKDAAQDAGAATKKTAKKGAHKTKKAVNKGAEKTKEGAKKVQKKTQD